MARIKLQHNQPHAGILVARQFEKGELLRRTLASLESLTPETLANGLRFI